MKLKGLHDAHRAVGYDLGLSTNRPFPPTGYAVETPRTYRLLLHYKRKRHFAAVFFLERRRHNASTKC